MTSSKYQLWLGMAGVAQDENPAALQWQRRLHWPMIAIALLVIPSTYLDGFSSDAFSYFLGIGFSVFVFLAFLGELVLMLVLVQDRWRYLLYNWLGVLIVLGTGVALLVDQAELMPLLRIVRLLVAGIILLRALRSLRDVFSPQALPYILGLGALFMALAGAGFYWLEPSVHSYAEGLWLAFTSGATVGYGDFVPTTWPARIFAVLMVFLGYALMSVATASIAAFFIGEDERAMRRELHHDIRQLRDEVKRLRDDLDHYERKRDEEKNSGW